MTQHISSITATGRTAAQEVASYCAVVDRAKLARRDMMLAGRVARREGYEVESELSWDGIVTGYWISSGNRTIAVSVAEIAHSWANSALRTRTFGENYWITITGSASPIRRAKWWSRAFKLALSEYGRDVPGCDNAAL